MRPHEAEAASRWMNDPLFHARVRATVALSGFQLDEREVRQCTS